MAIVVMSVVAVAAAGVAGVLWPHLAAPVRAAGDHVRQSAVSAPMTGLAPLPTLIASALAADIPVIAWVSHAGARLEPCGCVAGMHGGLVRRASLLTRLARGPHLVVEGGGWSGGSADYQLLRTHTYLDALQTSGCMAIGLGTSDVRLGNAVLRNLIGLPLVETRHGAQAPVVCANVHFDDGMPALRTLIRLTVGGHRFAITSVVSGVARGSGLTVDDPATALLRLLPTLDGAALIVIADLDSAALSDLAKGVPGISLLIGGDVEQPSPRAQTVGACRVVFVANEGKTIGYWPWGGEACAFELISDQVPDNPQVRAAIRRYQDQLGTMNLTIDERIIGLTTLTGESDAAHYLGSQACATCHREATRIHDHSDHARSFSALELKGYQRDPDCLRCHVTGLGLPDGYRRNAGTMQTQGAVLAQFTAEVSCESCHGRGSIHVAERSAGRPSSGSLTPVTPATCTTCHDPENSPHFEFTSYWPRIHHDSR